MTGLPELDTERLRLRAWRDEDLEPYGELCADAEVMRWLHGPMTRDESIAQVGAIREHWAREGFGMWAVAPKETDGCIGFVGLGTPSHVPEVLPAVEIGWRLARPYWGQGLATEGARATVDFAFGPLALDRIVSITQLPNRASRRVMEKLGMTPERTTVHPEHGHDVIVYELLAPGAR
jgi:RimJ/RimL family protein N-acetyltransferase